MAREVRVNIVGDASRLERALTRSDRSMASTGRNAVRLQTVLAGALAGGAIIRGTAGVVNAYAKYDTALREVGAVSGATGKSLSNLGSIAREAGLQTGTGATEATKAMAELAKAGLQTAEIGPALRGTLNLAQAGGLGTAEAAEAAANALGSFKLRGSEATTVADQFANAANLTTADVGDFAMAMSQGASAAKTAGLDFGETNLALTMLARNAVKGSDAGTSLKSAITQLASPTKAAIGEMDKYGLTFFKANGSMKSVADISDMLHDKLGGLTKQQQLSALTTLAGTDGQRALGAMMGFTREEAEALSKQLERQGSAAETARAKQAGFQGSMNKLRASAEELSISLGEQFAPEIAKFADHLTDLAADPETKARIVGTLSSFADGARDLWEAVEPGAELVGDLGQAFSDLPGPVKAALVQLTALSLIAGKLRGLVGVGGVAGSVSRMRGELDRVPASSRRAAAGIAAASAAASAPAAPGRAAALARTPTFTVPMGTQGAKGLGALEMQTVTRAQIDDRAQLAQRDQSIAARNAVRARQALAAAEIAEANASRRAIGARAVPRTAANRGIVAAADAQLDAARKTTVAAKEAARAATVESASARQRLTTARGVQAMAARAGATPALAAAAPATRGARALSFVGNAGAGLASTVGRNRGNLALAAGAGGLGAALSGGDVKVAALSGAALGSAAGPIGIAAGALVGAGTTALVNHFKGIGAKRTAAAAKTYAEQVTGATERAMQSGLRREPAQRLGRATSTLTAGRQALRDFDRGERLRRSNSVDDRANGIRLQNSARDRANAAGLDLDALRKGTSNAYRKAGEVAASAFGEGLKTYKRASAAGLMDQFRRNLGDAPRHAQQAGALSMVRFAQSLERTGGAPKGTADRLIRALGREFDGLAPMVAGSARQSSRELERGLGDQRAVRAANVTAGRIVDEYGAMFAGLPRIAVRTLPGAVATLRTQLDRLRIAASDSNPSKEMRDQARAALPGLRKAYQTTLARLATDMGVSEKDAARWARRVSRASRDAGGSSIEVDKLKESVRRLTAQLTTKEKVDELAKAWEGLGLSAQRARALAEGPAGPPAPSQLDPTTAFPAPPVPGRRNTRPRSGFGGRTGGRLTAGGFRAFSDGGMVPSLVSPGEEIEYQGRSMIVPGARVAADSVPMLLPVGARVFTDHGQSLMAAGATPQEALAEQLPHFRVGGAVKRYAKGGWVRTGATVDPFQPGNPMNHKQSAHGGMSFAELLVAGANAGLRPNLTDLLGLKSGRFGMAIGTDIKIRKAGTNGPGHAIRKSDNGSGQRGDRRYTIDLHDGIARRIGFGGKGDVEVAKMGTPGSARAGLSSVYTKDRKVQERIRRTYGKSDDRGGLLDDAYGIGIEAVNTFGSRKAARRYGNPVAAALREALDAQRDSYVRIRERTIQGAADNSLTSKVGKSLANRLEGTAGGGTRLRRLTAALGTMSAIAAKRYDYSYGGGHTQLGKPGKDIRGNGKFGFDCSGYVSAGLGAAGFIKSPMATAQGAGLNVLGKPGAGRFLTWGVRGSSGLGAHTMMKIGNTYWESGSGHGPRRVAGWAGKFAYRHMPGYAQGGIVGSTTRRRLAKPKAFDPTSSDFVGWGLRRGGTVRRFAAGGVVGYNPFDSAALDRLPGHRPGPRAATALGALSKSTSQANVDAFTAAIGNETMRRVETMRRSLLREIRGSGDRQQIDRLRSALSVIEADIGGRIAESVLASSKALERFDGAKAKAAHARAMEGVEDSSAIGLRASVAEGQRFLQRVAPGARDDLVEARERTKREMAKATTKEGKATLAGQLTEIRGKIKDLDSSVLGTEEEVAAAKRALPRQLATERVAGIDLADALAGLTVGTDDDRAAMVARLGESQRQMGEARRTGDTAWLTEAAGAMKTAADALRDFDDNQRQVGFGLDAALAALTDGDADDRAVLEKQRDDAQRRLDESMRAGDKERATQAATDLKSYRDALDQNTAAQEEANQLAQSRMDLDRELLQTQQRVVAGQELLAGALPAALGRIAGGGIASNLGTSVLRSSAVPAVPGQTTRKY